MGLENQRRGSGWGRSGFEDVVDITLDELAALGRGRVPSTNRALDPHHVRDCFLDLLADSYAVFREAPLCSSDAQLNDGIGEVYLAAYEVDWTLAGPWLLEAAVDAVMELYEASGEEVRPRFYADS